MVLPEVRRQKQAPLSPHCSRDHPRPPTPALQKGARQNNSQFAEPSVDQASYTQGRQCRGAEGDVLQPPRESRDCPWPEWHPLAPGPSTGLPIRARGSTSSLTHLALATERCQQSQWKKTGWIYKVDTSYLLALIKYFYSLPM